MRTDWPNGAQVAVSLTFDVDAEAGWLGEGPAYANRLSTLSEARFGITRGLPRILDTPRQARHQGHVLRPRRHRRAPPRGDQTRSSHDGHEIGHHGYLHLRSDAIDADAQREEIERGFAALQTASRHPDAATAPRAGSSRRRRSRCSRARLRVRQQPDGRRPPVHARRTGCSSCPCTGASTTGRTCTGSRAAATRSPRRRPSSTPGSRSSSRRSRDGRHVTYTMHPEVIGRGYRVQLLDDLIAAIANGPTYGSRPTAMWQPSVMSMTFPVHRSDEADRARARRGVRPRPGAAGRSTRSPSTAGCSPSGARERPAGAPAAREEIDAIAAGADVDAHDAASDQRPHGDPRRRGPTSARSIGAGGLLAQNWDWHPDLSASTVVWIVEHARRLVRHAHRGRHPGQDRPQRRGPRRLPEHPPHDGGRRERTAPRSTSCCARCSRLPHRRRGDRAT